MTFEVSGFDRLAKKLVSGGLKHMWRNCRQDIIWSDIKESFGREAIKFVKTKNKCPKLAGITKRRKWIGAKSVLQVPK